MILAHDKNFGIGKNGRLAWKNSEDLQHFKRITMNQTCLVGRTTFETLPKLPNRTLVVATNNNISNVFKPDMIIIGGKQVYEYCLKNDLVHTAIVTEIDGEYDCDVFMDKGFLDGFTLDKQEQLSTCKISWYKKKDSY